MPVPDYQTLMLPVLCVAAKGEIHARDVIARLSEELGLSEEDRQQMLPSGKVTLMANRVHWAATYLVKAGLLHRPRRGYLDVTERGRSVLAERPGSIDAAFLRRFPEFCSFVGYEHKSPENGMQSLPPPPAAGTPEERIEQAAEELTADLATTLLDRVLTASPTFFEQLIIDLMNAMGYGGSGSSRRVGRSGDGGIDGVINEDVLGLDIVCLQAKRYAPGNSIGPDKIREFAGSLDERGATKGVFVTTSCFTAQALLYAERSPKRLILIDGERLAKLMIRYGVGVRTSRTFELRKIDLDYFNEPE